MLQQNLILPATMGKLVTITPSDPAAGADFSFAVPVNTIILPLSFTIQLETDATAVTRTFSTVCFDGTDKFFRCYSQKLHTASLTFAYTCQIANNQLPTNANFYWQVLNMSPYQFLRFGDSFQTSVTELQAGDELTSPVLRYMQWIQES